MGPLDKLGPGAVRVVQRMHSMKYYSRLIISIGEERFCREISIFSTQELNQALDFRVRTTVISTNDTHRRGATRLEDHPRDSGAYPRGSRSFTIVPSQNNGNMGKVNYIAGWLHSRIPYSSGLASQYNGIIN